MLIEVTIERTGGVKGRSVSAMVFVAGGESVSLPLAGGATDGAFTDAAGEQHSMLAAAVLANLRSFHADSPFDDGTKFTVPDLRTFYTYSVADGVVIPGGWGKATTLTADATIEQRQALAQVIDADARTSRLCATPKNGGTGKGAKQAKAVAGLLSLLTTGVN